MVVQRFLGEDYQLFIKLKIKREATMRKRFWTAIVLALGLVLLLTNIAMTAQKITDLRGTWSGNEVWGYWDGANYVYNPPATMVLVVADQNNTLFYGTIFDAQPITGTITGKTITATASAWGGVLILNGTLKGKTIMGTFNYFTGDGSWVETGNFQITKQLTP